LTSLPAPLGATVSSGGVNFSVFSKDASLIELLLFDRADDATPSRVIPIDATRNRDYHYWHVFVPDLGPGQLYAYRASGAFDPANGLRFDSAKTLLDPYGRGVAVPTGFSRAAASRPGVTAATAMKSIVTDPTDYDWEGDRPLNTPSSRTIVYEMHVRGFTRHPSSGVSAQLRGTYAGLI
jgi:glycogen operon protein